MSKRWSKTEIAHLKRNADSQTLEELAQRFHAETAEVRAKMEELGLAGASSDDHDAAVASFEKALNLVHDGKWKKAAEALEGVIGESDTSELSDRARQYLAICQHRIDGEPDIKDAYLAAVVSKNRGDMESAQTLAKKAGSADKDHKIAYLQASLHALAGDEDQAIAVLGKAIQLDARNRVQAFHDPDFRELARTRSFKNSWSRPTPERADRTPSRPNAARACSRSVLCVYRAGSAPPPAVRRGRRGDLTHASRAHSAYG